jgi:hypothetical protein
VTSRHIVPLPAVEALFVPAVAAHDPTCDGLMQPPPAAIVSGYDPCSDRGDRQPDSLA